jgi:hypothetical protein
LRLPRTCRTPTPRLPAEPPASWIDPDTGHRVIRLTREPGSDSFYFNVNGYTPDGKRMAYTTPNGISVLNLETLEAKQLVAGPARAIVVASKTANLYYTRATTNRFFSQLWCVNLDTGENRKIADLPRRAGVSTINADETLGAGTFIEGDANAGGAYDGTVPSGKDVRRQPRRAGKQGRDDGQAPGGKTADDDVHNQSADGEN